MGRCMRKKGPVVVTSLGKVEGSLMSTKEGRRIYSYRGIPYGQPPLGSLRFKRPEPITCWSGTRNCRQEMKKSLQPHVLFPDKRYLDVGTEDCLYLSVFTKAAPKYECLYNNLCLSSVSSDQGKATRQTVCCLPQMRRRNYFRFVFSLTNLSDVTNIR